MTGPKNPIAPIIVKRTGELISAPVLTAEQQEDLSMAVFKAFCRLHPEVIREAVENFTRQSPGSAERRPGHDLP